MGSLVPLTGVRDPALIPRVTTNRTQYPGSGQTDREGKADHRPVTASLPFRPRTLAGHRRPPLLAPIDQWGYVPFPLQQLTPHSLSRRVRNLLAGDLGAHRHLPIDPDEDTEPDTPTPVPVATPTVYSREDSRRAWSRRRADLKNLAGVDAVLDAVDARAKELERRTAAILIGQTTIVETTPRTE